MTGWHTDPENWHGPIDRTEQAAVWDLSSQEMVQKIVEYRACGCIIWKEA